MIGGHDPLRLDVDPRRRPIARAGARRRRRGPAGRRHRGAERRRRRRARGARRGRRGRGRARAPRARRSSDVSVPSAVYGLSAYYLIAPAEASSNLARYDGVRYGLRVDGDDVATMNARTRAAGLRRRGEAPHHARDVRAVGRLLRRVLRPGAARPHADHPRLRPRVRAVRRAALPDVADGRVRARRARPPTRSRCTCRDVCTIPTNLAGHAAMSVPFGTGARRPAGRRAGARARARRAGDVPRRPGRSRTRAP